MVPEGRSPDGGKDVSTFRYSPEDDDQPLVAIVEAVAWVKGEDVRDLDPLQRVVDIEALQAQMRAESSQFTSSRADSDSDELEVTFQYEGCEVSVSRGTIRISRD